MKYKVEIVEKLSMFVEVEASSAEEALGRVTKKYWNEEIIVESTQGPDVEFFVSPPKEGKILRLFRKLFRCPPEQHRERGYSRSLSPVIRSLQCCLPHVPR
jgi:hypothetical protein